MRTRKLFCNDRGEPLSLAPLLDETGIIFLTSEEKPIYPVPVRDPQTADWAIDRDGEILLCPPIRDRDGQIFEYDGVPAFLPPAYSFADGGISLRKDEDGAYLFCDVKRDEEGKILRSPQGLPIFNPSYL